MCSVFSLKFEIKIAQKKFAVLKLSSKSKSKKVGNVARQFALYKFAAMRVEANVHLSTPLEFFVASFPFHVTKNIEGFELTIIFDFMIYDIRYTIIRWFN